MKFLLTAINAKFIHSNPAIYSLRAGAGEKLQPYVELAEFTINETIRFVREHFDMTILLIEHDMKLVSGICEELTVLNFGHVLRQGKTSDVLHDPEVIKAYLGE